jgi:hypothetical protein
MQSIEQNPQQSATSSKNGSAEQDLWCVELVPKRKQLTDRDLKHAIWLARGIPADPIGELFWMAMVMGGLADDRGPDFARIRQRLVVFKNRKDALATARKEENEFWSARVRQVWIV